MTAQGAQRIGDRLRRIRHQQGLSLADVQERSAGEWKAVVVGAYERGSRAVTITRLAGLAQFYGVPLADLLPRRASDRDRGGEPRTVLDLTHLDRHDDQLAAVARFAEHLQRIRGDRNGQMLTLRRGDLVTIASALGSDTASLRTTLEERGALIDVADDDLLV